MVTKVTASLPEMFPSPRLQLVSNPTAIHQKNLSPARDVANLGNGDSSNARRNAPGRGCRK